MQDAAQRLMSPDSDPNASMDVYYGFPPSSIAVFEVLGEWALLDGAECAPRGLQELLGCAPDETGIAKTAPYRVYGAFSGGDGGI